MRMRRLIWLMGFFVLPNLAEGQQVNKTYKEVLLLMGSRFEFTAVTADSVLAMKAIANGIKEVKRIEKLISSWDPQSQTADINAHAGIKPVKVDLELYQLIGRSLKVSALTQGAFDISYASLDKIWKFDGSVAALPPKSMIEKSVAKIGYEKIILDQKNQSVYLSEKGMKIGFGAIGKGYAANKAKQVMQSTGIVNGVVNAGGDLISWGKQSEGKNWRIGIANPKNKLQIMSWLDISDMAVVTSGNYEKFILIDNTKYSHIIDPRTGYPSKGIKSVTIFCPNAELADALATSTFILGKENGLNLINQLKGIEALLITDQDELVSSKNLVLQYYNKEVSGYDFKLDQK